MYLESLAFILLLPLNKIPAGQEEKKGISAGENYVLIFTMHTVLRSYVASNKMMHRPNEKEKKICCC